MRHLFGVFLLEDLQSCAGSAIIVSSGYSVFMYDWFFTEGQDMFPGENLTKEQAEKKLFEAFPDCKLEEIEEETTKFVNKGNFGLAKEITKENYYIAYYSDLVEGSYLKIEKRRI